MLGSATLSARAHVWSSVPNDATVEQRLAALEKNVRRVRDDLSGHEKEADDRARSHVEDLKRERSEREAADRAIHEKIKEAETGGLKLNAAGVWWLVSGTICSTFPGELSRLVGGS
jgi:septal ring factor EnvC (AmiA/AmiB activator)